MSTIAELLKRDPHSYYQPGQPKMTHLHWDAYANFKDEILQATAHLTFDGAGVVDLDTRDLEIMNVRLANGDTVPFVLGVRDAVLGSKLTLTVPYKGAKVLIQYRTSKDASGLKWLPPEQTGSGKFPFLFSQGECIHARSYVPCQDTPGIKFTVTADLTVPIGLRGLLASNKHLGRSETGGYALERWEMEFPIPAYLIALAVGELESIDLSEDSRVWAEPHLVRKAADEFSEVPEMLKVAIAQFGDYPFGRYDLLIMPMSFPYGGMENPCLSFLTPSLITGDKSMVSVVRHELMHSYFGNNVTNADWGSFWINEGFTVYGELRLTEAIEGTDVAMLGFKLLELEFERDLQRFAKTRPSYTALALDVNGIDPDDAFSRVPYFKGAQMLRHIEEYVGRDRLDSFLQSYTARFSFASINSVELLNFMEEEFGVEVVARLHLWEWIFGTGIPEWAPEIESALIDAVVEVATQGRIPSVKEGKSWSAQQWMLYLDLLPRTMSRGELKLLDDEFRLSYSRNSEIMAAYLLLATENGYILPHQVTAFLMTHGRMKYLNPLYGALAKTPDGLSIAKEIFAEAKPTYHAIAAGQVERVFREAA